VDTTPADRQASRSSTVPAHPATTHRALDAVSPVLRCPICLRALQREHTRLSCTERHRFDIARQGYVNLTPGHVRHRGDTSAMVAARESFLSHGHYQPLVETMRVLAVEHDPHSPGTVLDLAGGTGHYLASVLNALPDRHGICLDASTAALRRAARAHPRAVAVGADAWQRWPLAAHSASTVINVFAPRNAAETRRVLTPDGIIITAAPAPEHLRELVGALRMPTIDPHKTTRLAATFHQLDRLDSQLVAYRLGLDHAQVQALAGMGPAARHTSTAALKQRISHLPEPVGVTVAVEVTVHRMPDHRRAQSRRPSDRRPSDGDRSLRPRHPGATLG